MIFRTKSELTDHWEVHFDDITLARIIGEGAFGKVYSGDFFKKSNGSRSRRISSRWGKKDTKDQKKPLRVAVKMLRSKIYDYKNVQSHTLKSRCKVDQFLKVLSLRHSLSVPSRLRRPLAVDLWQVWIGC